MHLHRSDKLEVLVDALGRAVAEPLSSPFFAETIVVPTRALGRWLALRLAELHGIWANPRFVTAEAFVDELYVEALGAGGDDPFARDGLTWSIAAALPALLTHRSFASVAGYLAEDHDAAMRIALAQRLGRTFHGYLLLRPELIDAWERSAEDTANETAAWQAELWRALVAKHGGDHRARRHQNLVAQLAGSRPVAGQLPERVSVFAPESLPPAVLDVLEAIATRAEVHVFTRRNEHPLGESMGARGRALDAAITARAGLVTHDESAPASSPSLLIHSCHAPMRECEVLRDQLLAALDEDRSLQARDILVLCPDLETYAPVIDAVFGIDDTTDGFLPYRIVDRSARRELAVVEAFLTLLDLAPSRATATDVVDLLAREPVRTRFSLDENELDVVREWVADCGIRWGEDAAHRKDVGQPPFRENTWGFGLDRLLLGYAMGSAGQAMCNGCLPYDDVEGTTSSTLGGLAAFCEQLFAVRKTLLGLATLPAWRDRLVDALPRLFSAPWQTEFQHQMIRAALDTLVEHALAAGFGDEVPLSVVRDALAADLDERAAAMEHAPGGITFASFASNRCVPSRIVVMLGMNDGDFPRVRHASAFDLVAMNPRPGDPSTRDDDRQAFLDALLGARDRLIITYIGQSIATNAERPPSVVVSELLDSLGNDAAAAKVVVKHPLHAFSPKYFGDSDDKRLFSHAAALCDGARSMRSASAKLPPFVRRPLPRAERSNGVTLDALVRFFEHPIRGFVTTRVGVSLGWDVAPLEDREPLDFDNLKQWAVGTELLERARDGEDLATMPPDLVAQGVLPLGIVGWASYQALAPEILAVAEAVNAVLDRKAPLPPREVDLYVAGADTRITGWLRNLGEHGLVHYRFGRVHGRTRVGAWVRHLVLCCMGIDRPTTLIGKSDGAVVKLRYRTVAEPEKLLARLVDLYWLGLEAPLLFLPDAAAAYVTALPNGLGKAEKAASTAYRDKFGLFETCKYVAKVLGERDPIDPDFALFSDPADAARYPSFATVARDVFEPLLAHEETL